MGNFFYQERLEKENEELKQELAKAKRMTNVFKSKCRLRENCINKDSMICGRCLRNMIAHDDYFEQDAEVVKSRFRELVKARFNKTN